MNIKKLMASGVATAVFFGLSFAPSFAQVERVPGPVEYGPWTLVEGSEIEFTCGGGSYVHTLETVEDEDGDVSGTGYYNTNPDYTWDMTGSISDLDISMDILYTGLSAGSTYNLDGVIDPTDGSVSGTASGNCESFAMPAGSVERESSQFTGNHGQYVRSQEDKKSAAHSSIGMPVNSQKNVE